MLYVVSLLKYFEYVCQNLRATESTHPIHGDTALSPHEQPLLVISQAAKLIHVCQNWLPCNSHLTSGFCFMNGWIE